MATKTARRPLSAKEHDADHRAWKKRMGRMQKRWEERDKKNASLWREIRRIADE